MPLRHIFLRPAGVTLAGLVRGCRIAALLAALLLPAACATRANRMQTDFIEGEIRHTEHRGAADDLLSAGLGLAGLREATAPPPADPEAPTAAELRRRALHANWRGIADLSPGGGYGTAYGAIPPVPGREYSAFARLAGARQPHRVLAQVPDAFDHKARCLVVTASSGSRGIYGAIALAGAWGLPRGCAVAYTDKGAGSGHFDLDSGSGVALDGRRAAAGSTALEFEPIGTDGAAAHRIAMKHAHSQDHPEADWGRQVIQAAAFGLHALDLAFPEDAPFTPENTRIIAAGLSNGGGAVLRAAELEQGAWFDAVVAVAPNVQVAGGRALLDYAAEAALLQPCALLALPEAIGLLPPALVQAQGRQRCAALAAAGLLDGADADAQAADALARLRASGWGEAPLNLAQLNTGFDLWRAVLATYLQSYLRAPVGAPVCDYGFAALDAGSQPRASSAAERALWWSDSSGIAPGAGVQLVDSLATGPDPTLPGLLCAQRLLQASAEPQALALRAAVEATRATARPRSPQVLVVHGGSDALVPIDFSARPYVAAAQAAGHSVSLWEIERAQHFDAFLAAPALSGHVPLLAYGYAALDRIASVLDGQSVPPESALVRPRARVAGSVLTRDALLLP